jgi:hypothetical protein
MLVLEVSWGVVFWWLGRRPGAGAWASPVPALCLTCAWILVTPDLARHPGHAGHAVGYVAGLGHSTWTSTSMVNSPVPRPWCLAPHACLPAGHSSSLVPGRRLAWATSSRTGLGGSESWLRNRR